MTRGGWKAPVLLTSGAVTATVVLGALLINAPTPGEAAATCHGSVCRVPRKVVTGPNGHMPSADQFRGTLASNTWLAAWWSMSDGRPVAELPVRPEPDLHHRFYVACEGGGTMTVTVRTPGRTLGSLSRSCDGTLSMSFGFSEMDTECGPLLFEPTFEGQPVDAEYFVTSSRLPVPRADQPVPVCG